MQNVTSIERDFKPEANSESLIRKRQTSFPLTITAVKEKRMPAIFTERLPALTEKESKPPAPVRIMDITFKSGREFFVDGKKLELPYGVKKRITVRALKKLAGGYAGSIILVKRGNSYVRLRDPEAIEIPEAGEELEVKSLPSYRLE